MKKNSNKKTNLTGVFNDNLDALKRFLSSYLKSSHDIEDVLQDTYIRAVEAERTQEIKNPRAFLYRVCRNLAINQNNLAFKRLSDSLDDFDGTEVAPDRPQLDEELDQAVRFKAFVDAVRHLPPQCRKVFLLRKVYGLKNIEIANRLEVSVSTVEKHLAKGLLLCKDHLEEQHTDFLSSEDRQNLLN